MIDMLGLLLRLGLSLAAVLGLMWLAARVLRGPATRGTGVVELVARQQVGRGAAVAVLRVADRALEVGVTDAKVTLISEADLEAIELARLEAEETRSAANGSDRPAGVLPGSVLSPDTWRRVVEVVRDRTARRG